MGWRADHEGWLVSFLRGSPGRHNECLLHQQSGSFAIILCVNPIRTIGLHGLAAQAFLPLIAQLHFCPLYWPPTFPAPCKVPCIATLRAKLMQATVAHK